MGRRYRDAGTGEYVSEEYADTHPGTTVGETEAVPPATVTGVLQEEIVMANETADQAQQAQQEREAQREAEQSGQP